MAQTIAMPSKECSGVDVEYNGIPVASYDARGGMVNVDNRNIADKIRKTVGAGGRVYGFAQSTAPTVECACGRTIFAAFGTVCWPCQRKQDERRGQVGGDEASQIDAASHG